MTLHRNVRLLAWFNFWIDFRPYAPVAILYFAQVSGSYALGMSIYSLIMLFQSLFEVPTGVFSDMIGRKRTMVCGAAASVLSLVCFSIGGVYLMLVVGAIFAGLARAFYSGNNEALLYDTLAENDQQEHFPEYLGKTSSTSELALGSSAVVGSFIAAISFTAAFWLSVIPMVLAFIVTLQFSEPKTHTHTTTNIYTHLGTAFRNIIHNPRLRMISAATVLTYALGESAYFFRSAFVERLWPVWALGIAQMLANLSGAVSFYFAGRLIKRFGEFKLLIGGAALSEVVNLVGLLIPSVISPALVSFSGFFFGVNRVASGGLMQREFTDEQRATMGSLNSFAGSVVFAVFSFLLGALADNVGVVPALVIVALLSLIPMVLYWLGLRKPNAETAESV